LVGPGWSVEGDRWWDGASKAWYLRPYVKSIVDALEDAYEADLDGLQAECVDFAKRYDADYVYETYWRPYIAGVMDTRPAATQAPMTDVAVLVPCMNRPGNVARLVESFNRSNDGTANLYYICDEDDADQIAAVEAADVKWLPAVRGTSFAAKINEGYARTDESWLFVTGDDVEFTPGWIEAARGLSDRYDVIGTNDSEPGRIRNPKVAAGSHADHFFVRRAYVDDEGSSLEGPGVVLAEAYYHFYTDVETIQLAKALDANQTSVSLWKAQGMPTDSVDAARAWLAANIRRRKSGKVAAPTTSTNPALGPKARLDRAAEGEIRHYELWKAAANRDLRVIPCPVSVSLLRIPLPLGAFSRFRRTTRRNRHSAQLPKTTILLFRLDRVPA
jgi:hypothetical protein